MFELNNQFLWAAALIRVLLQFLPIDWQKLPIAARVGNGLAIHRFGFFLALGVLIFTTPYLML